MNFGYCHSFLDDKSHMNVHQVDNGAFLNDNANAKCVDPEEVVMVYVTRPSYAEVVDCIHLGCY
jgi:hypothetical protein